MNREIKFRGQRIDTKEWVYGYYFISPLTDENSGVPVGCGWCFLSDDIIRHCISTQNGLTYVVIPETVGQYVGLDDTKEKGIYEGDKVSAFDHYTQTQFEGVVGFRHGSFMIYNEAMSHFRLSDYEMEVIGNIHNNPVKEGI